jgi:hypothetical protein
MFIIGLGAMFSTVVLSTLTLVLQNMGTTIRSSYNGIDMNHSCYVISDSTDGAAVRWQEREKAFDEFFRLYKVPPVCLVCFNMITHRECCMFNNSAMCLLLFVSRI